MPETTIAVVLLCCFEICVKIDMTCISQEPTNISIYVFTILALG